MGNWLSAPNRKSQHLIIMDHALQRQKTRDRYGDPHPWTSSLKPHSAGETDGLAWLISELQKDTKVITSDNDDASLLLPHQLLDQQARHRRDILA